MILIGIDPGVKTGFAKMVDGVMREVKTYTIVEAMNQLKQIITQAKQEKKKLKVYIEDARMRKWIPSQVGREVLQGVGSVKRDCAIWQEFCVHHAVDYELVPPKNNTTKLNAEQFKKITGWVGRTSEHARDAAMLIRNQYCWDKMRQSDTKRNTVR